MRVSKKLAAINKVIKALEQAGYKVEMQHSHVDRSTTTIFISLFDSIIAIGKANCSTKDQFDPAIGAQIAFSRAMTNLTISTSREHVKDIIAR